MPAQSGRSVGPNQLQTRPNGHQASGARTAPTGGDRIAQYGPGFNSGGTRTAAPDRRFRSAYGIRNSFDAPVGPTPWPVRFINALSERSAKIRARYWTQSSSGQIVGTAGEDSYATKLQSQWRSGGARGSRADPITQSAQIPTTMAGWPHRVGATGIADMPLSPYKMDPRDPNLVNGKVPMYLPRYEGGQIRLHSETGQRAGEYLPTRFSVTPPMRIVRMHRYGTGMMAGAAQFATQQTWGQYNDGGSLVVSPVNVLTGMKSRQIRSVRGVLSPKGGTGRERIPAVFTPQTVQ